MPLDQQRSKVGCFGNLPAADTLVGVDELMANSNFVDSVMATDKGYGRVDRSMECCHQTGGKFEEASLDAIRDSNVAIVFGHISVLRDLQYLWTQETGARMKIGIVGKGGVGKTTTSSLLARVLVGRGRRVLAVDTDSNPNLGLSLGLSPEATETLAPIPRSMVVGQRGDMTVAELMEDFSVATPEGVALMSALRVDEAGAGCTCGGHASVKSLLGQALQSETDDTIIDMEAGIEHLSRAGGTLADADVLILMMEPSRKAVITAQRTIGLAKELGIKRWIGVGNKVDTDEARQAIEELCAQHEVPLDVMIPSTPDILAADRRGEPLDRAIAPDVWNAVEKLVDSLNLEAVSVG